jgi:sulfhydrogenase subunit beta (sulfur reductase)
MAALTIQPAALQGILNILIERGYTIIGPQVRASAIVLDDLTSLNSLPGGWRDRQAPGTYAISRNGQAGLFQHSCGPHSWKRYLYPPQRRLFSVGFKDSEIQLERTDQPVPAYAFVGIRPCDLNALAILDGVLAAPPYSDPYYLAVRRNLFIIAVNCLQPGGTCFCSLMGAGPRAETGYDIVLDEICEPDRHVLIAEPGSRDGADLLAVTDGVPASAADTDLVRQMSAAAAHKMNALGNLSDAGALFDTCFNHPHWQTLETSCLACGNCTLVCPTCFCHTITEAEHLEDGHAERHLAWDSCFNKAFSYIHGGSIRTNIASRYRQWLCHKLATWQQQFGTAGCVGCGRCRTWCPAGIDMVEEAMILLGDESRREIV